MFIDFFSKLYYLKTWGFCALQSGFLELFGTFPLANKKNFQHFLCQNSPKIGIKCPQPFRFGHPSPFSTQNSKLFGHKKVLQNFWIGSEPPPPLLMENTQITAAFFSGSFLILQNCKITQSKKIPHTGDTKSLDCCG